MERGDHVTWEGLDWREISQCERLTSHKLQLQRLTLVNNTSFLLSFLPSASHPSYQTTDQPPHAAANPHCNRYHVRPSVRFQAIFWTTDLLPGPAALSPPNRSARVTEFFPVTLSETNVREYFTPRVCICSDRDCIRWRPSVQVYMTVADETSNFIDKTPALLSGSHQHHKPTLLLYYCIHRNFHQYDPHTDSQTSFCLHHVIVT